jgi:hypothetical protein
MTPETPSLLFQFAREFGFPALVSFLLGAFIWTIGRGIMSELGRLTRAVTLVVLSMQFAPERAGKAFKEEAERLYDESAEASKKRGEDISRERHRKK